MIRHSRVRQIIAGAAVIAAVMAYVVVRYGDAVGTFFFLDDFWVLRDADAVYRGGEPAWLAIFRPGHNGLKLYRPLTTVGYFYFLRTLFGLDAGAYHAFHMLVFAINASLVAVLVRLLTASWGWGLAGGLLYASAPGHALAVYWIGAATMTVTTTVVLLSLLWWLCAPRRWRGAGAVVLQTVALGCSEHALVVPALLVWLMLFGAQRASLRETAWAVAPPVVVTGIYFAAKLGYFLVKGFPGGGYAPVFDVAAWLTNLGLFALATNSLATLVIRWPPAVLAVGGALLAALPVLGVMVRRRGGAWALPAVGLWMFVTALLPVLPLTQHFYRYFIGVAAFGMVLAVVGVFRALPRGGGILAASLVAVVLVTDRVTCDQAALFEPTMSLFRATQAAGLKLLRGLDETVHRAPPGSSVYLPDSPLNMSVIGFGGADRVFFNPPIRIFYGADPASAVGVQPLPLLPPGPDIPVPGADPRWDWLRRAAPALHSSGTAGCG